MDYFNYRRRRTNIVNIGATPLGGSCPIRLQSMTNTSTRDTDACVEQTLRIVAAGGEYVRLTTQGRAEAENLKNINAALRRRGCQVPLVADVHFNANVADVAALYAEKVRINPGNYVDAARTFKHLDYTDEEYAQELQKIRDRFVPFLNICKEHHTAIRLGVNHGSLSDRIMSRYGDTPEGMVESCMEYLRICVSEHFTDVVISIKASNASVMVRTVRLLASVMDKEDMHFPLHLGVTEAGEGEDGRIKSALGIGALLSDGLGDTIRVSLSEAPEAEIPVAAKIRDYVGLRRLQPHIYAETSPAYDYLHPSRRKTSPVRNIGGDHVPVVIAARLRGQQQFSLSSTPDYAYIGKGTPDGKHPDVQYIVDADVWTGQTGTWPAYSREHLPFIGMCPAPMKFLFVTWSDLDEEILSCLHRHPEVVLLCSSKHLNRAGELRAIAHKLMIEGLDNPMVIIQTYADSTEEDLEIHAAIDMGPLVFDGFCDGLMLFNNGTVADTRVDSIAFSILQAGRLRMSKTEYISCPGCGRTLYNLQDTIARIKAATSQYKGLKIGIMGCIVNGPGEMADADYGYVGAGRGHVSLYRKKECVERNIPEAEAVEHLLHLIGSDNK